MVHELESIDARSVGKGMRALSYLLVFLCSIILKVEAAEESVLPRFSADFLAAEVFPGADRFAVVEDESGVIAAFNGSDRIGYVFVNSDYVNSTGYSGKPIHLIIALDKQAVIRNVILVEHHEPIVLIGIPEKDIIAVLDKYIGMDVSRFALGTEDDHQVDAMSGATVTIMVMDDTIIRSSIKVARAKGLGGLKSERKATGPVYVVNEKLDKVEDWISVISDGSVRRLKITLGAVNNAFEKLGNIPAADRPEEGLTNDIFIELYAAPVSVPSIGRSLLGDAEYQNLKRKLEPGQQAILLAGNGRYSFKGSGYVRGGIFDRFQLIQGDISVRFHDRQHKRLRRIAADGATDFKDVDLFRIPADVGFDPTLPWKIELLVGRATSPTTKAFITFDLDYSLPRQYQQVSPKASTTAETSESAAEPLWKKIWLSKIPQIAVLMIGMIVLTIIFFFQNDLASRPKLTDRVRTGFLLFTLFGIGFYANAQLSVVNILTVFNALASGFNWEYFLLEPSIFILWSSVAASLLLWGRGPFCGWLCPFGALQELLNRVAKAVKIPQKKLPWGLHERLWALKYIIFLVLFGFSLHSLGWAERLAEIEPFKTAIILKFMREWPFVIFAVLLLIAGLFIERFYCRYICPLGAALAIPGHLRIFNWLRRYKECGTPCQICSNECMVGAIHPEGNININECLYCLHCQVRYFDSHVCPVMIKKRGKRERREAMSSSGNSVEVSKLMAEIKAGVGSASKKI